jgi:hypothetical protein
VILLRELPRSLIRSLGCRVRIGSESESQKPSLEDEQWVSSGLERSDFFVKQFIILDINENDRSCYRRAINYRWEMREGGGWSNEVRLEVGIVALRLDFTGAQSGYQPPFLDIAIESRLWGAKSSIASMLDMICFIVKETGI